MDATHPFAAQISNNAIVAAAATGVSLLAVERPKWGKAIDDDWDEHASIEAAIAALPTPQRIFSALGRSSLAALCRAPQHHYIVRVVDPITPPPGLPHATIITARVRSERRTIPPSFASMASMRAGEKLPVQRRLRQD
jgi:precorrin-6A/cobalt-precorrin-6A reductase